MAQCDDRMQQDDADLLLCDEEMQPLPAAHPRGELTAFPPEWNDAPDDLDDVLDPPVYSPDSHAIDSLVKNSDMDSEAAAMVMSAMHTWICNFFLRICAGVDERSATPVAPGWHQTVDIVGTPIYLRALEVLCVHGVQSAVVGSLKRCWRKLQRERGWDFCGGFVVDDELDCHCFPENFSPGQLDFSDDSGDAEMGMAALRWFEDEGGKACWYYVVGNNFFIRLVSYPGVQVLRIDAKYRSSEDGDILVRWYNEGQRATLVDPMDDFPYMDENFRRGFMLVVRGRAAVRLTRFWRRAVSGAVAGTPPTSSRRIAKAFLDHFPRVERVRGMTFADARRMVHRGVSIEASHAFIGRVCAMLRNSARVDQPIGKPVPDPSGVLVNSALLYCTHPGSYSMDDDCVYGERFARQARERLDSVCALSEGFAEALLRCAEGIAFGRAGMHEVLFPAEAAGGGGSGTHLHHTVSTYVRAYHDWKRFDLARHFGKLKYYLFTVDRDRRILERQAHRTDEESAKVEEMRQTGNQLLEGLLRITLDAEERMQLVSERESRMQSGDYTNVNLTSRSIEFELEWMGGGGSSTSGSGWGRFPSLQHVPLTRAGSETRRGSAQVCRMNHCSIIFNAMHTTGEAFRILAEEERVHRDMVVSVRIPACVSAEDVRAVASEASAKPVPGYDRLLACVDAIACALKRELRVQSYVVDRAADVEALRLHGPFRRGCLGVVKSLYDVYIKHGADKVNAVAAWNRVAQEDWVALASAGGEQQEMCTPAELQCIAAALRRLALVINAKEVQWENAKLERILRNVHVHGVKTLQDALRVELNEAYRPDAMECDGVMPGVQERLLRGLRKTRRCVEYMLLSDAELRDPLYRERVRACDPAAVARLVCALQCRIVCHFLEWEEADRGAPCGGTMHLHPPHIPETMHLPPHIPETMHLSRTMWKALYNNHVVNALCVACMDLVSRTKWIDASQGAAQEGACAIPATGESQRQRNERVATAVSAFVADAIPRTPNMWHVASGIVQVLVDQGVVAEDGPPLDVRFQQRIVDELRMDGQRFALASQELQAYMVRLSMHLVQRRGETAPTGDPPLPLLQSSLLQPMVGPAASRVHANACVIACAIFQHVRIYGEFYEMVARDLPPAPASSSA